MNPFMNREAVEDEMPDAPETTGLFDATLLADVKKMATTIPAGTYPVRLAEYELKFPVAKEETEEEKEAREKREKKREKKVYRFDNGEEVGMQPYFNITFTVQTEQYLGKKLWKMVSWCSDEVFQRAAQGDKGAQEVIHNRLGDAKELMVAANYKPSGKANFVEDFLDKQPEMKAKVKKVPKQTMNEKGKWVASSTETKNEIESFLPLMSSR